MDIEITGGTSRERANVRDTKNGLLEGYKYLAMALGELFDKTPVRTLINVDSTRILNVYFVHHDRKRLTTEIALAEVFALGGRLDFINDNGYIIRGLTILPLGDVPLQQSATNVTLYNMWWNDHRSILNMLLNNYPAEFSAIRYTANDSSIIFQFKPLDDKRKG